MSLLFINQLSISFHRDNITHKVVDDLSLRIEEGSILGLVGESGSGKSVTSLAVMGLLPSKTTSFEGEISLQQQNLLSLSEKEMRSVRGSKIAMVFQEPMSALNPSMKLGAQVAEVISLHNPTMKSSEVQSKVLNLFQEVKLPRPEKLLNAWPHEISGGQQQRIMIAMALAGNPSLLIADEPTTALDVSVQAEILDLLKSLVKARKMGMLFISHDLPLVASLCDRIAVLLQGKLVEEGDAHQIIHQPQHPYTKGLIASKPPMNRRPRRLSTVADFVKENPTDEAEVIFPEYNHPLFEIDNLTIQYPLKKNWLGKTSEWLKALDSVTLTVFKGESLGIVGESGCGKSTLAKSLILINQPSSGDVKFEGKSIYQLAGDELLHYRKRVQFVFQNPDAALNPKITIGDALLEPLEVHGYGFNLAERLFRVRRMLERVGLNYEDSYKYPHEFSGGQKQRICIARALMLEPEVLILDESVAALDVSVQAQVLNLLNDLKEEFNLTYLFISHDLSVVKYFCNRIVVLNKGKLEEMNISDQLFAHPKQAYTQQLLNAIPEWNV